MITGRKVFSHCNSYLIAALLICVAGVNSSCNSNHDVNDSVSEYWLTTADETALLEKQAAVLHFSTETNNNPVIDIDTGVVMQTIDGFGYSLTGGSAVLISRMNPNDRKNLLNELFGKEGQSIAISYLRISIGASDLDSSVFSYDDLPAGQSDTALVHFSLSRDTLYLIPLLQEILKINPAIKIMASPWSPPVWMKDNDSSKGGHLLPRFYNSYARYFVKYIEAMKTSGISIDAITIQNEPEHGGNNPSMLMTAEQQTDFIKNHLGPSFQNAGIQTKIIIWDHNCDHPVYPITVLNDAGAKKYINGSAFHLYKGDISALSEVHDAHPDRQLYFTEQWTGARDSFSTDHIWHVKNVLIGSMRNWSRIALEWNLANDPRFHPHTPGGCTECKGAITIDGSSVKRNVSYYIIGHASRFVPEGSTRVASNNIPGVSNVAFKTASGKKVLIAVNDSTATVSFNIRFNGKWASTSLPGGAVATFTW